MEHQAFPPSSSSSAPQISLCLAAREGCVSWAANKGKLSLWEAHSFTIVLMCCTWRKIVQLFWVFARKEVASFNPQDQNMFEPLLLLSTK